MAISLTASRSSKPNCKPNWSTDQVKQSSTSALLVRIAVVGSGGKHFSVRPRVCGAYGVFGHTARSERLVRLSLVGNP